MRKSHFYLLLSIFALMSGCETDQDKYLKENERSLVKLFSDIDTIEADGVSKLNIIAILPSDANIKKVYFETSDGKFADSSVKKDSVNASFRNDSLIATIQLISSLQINAEVKVKATVKSIENVLTLKFTKAFPESISLESNVATIKSNYGSEVPLQVFLKRAQGLPSLHQSVELKAITNNNDSIGEFRGVDAAGSNNNGIINAIFVLKDTTYTGTLKLIASTITKTIHATDTLKILVTK